ncbi:DUF2929 family protein [Amphibacillus sp. Q70]|uniref:DUF2929 family protein n=1 Tax=Amphibacillus sp. Q70 TaxID=3453416 RepID=UPI003F8431C6
MRFIITILWSFAISLVLGYVLTSMGGYEFKIWPVILMGSIFSLIALFVGEGYIKEEH